MGIFETTIIYGLLGFVVAAAAVLSRPSQRAFARTTTFMTHFFLWPFFAPVLLGRAVDDHSPHEGPTGAVKTLPAIIEDPRIRQVEAQFKAALERVGGIAEELLGPQMESVRHLSSSLATMERRAREMDDLLDSAEFDQKKAEEALEQLLRRDDVDDEDPRIQSVRARLRNIERLHRMRHRSRRDLERALVKMEEMNSQLLLLQFADRPDGEIAESIQEIASTIDGLSEGLLAI